MGQLAFGVVGAVIGTVISPGLGTSIGWSLGSAIGGVVFAPDGAQTTGPRMEDLRANISTYGQPIPRCYGEIGFMTSVIDMDDMREFTNVQEQGKGGNPASATTFSYTCTFASLLCRGEDAEIPNTVPVAALNRIWVNEKCYYDVRDETNIEAMVASANFQQYFTFYPGSQTQLPDPTLEALHGVGNVPGYRGRSYIVFKDLPLAFVQNQPPGLLRITTEVVMTGTPPTGLRILKTVGPNAPASNNAYYQLMPVTSGVIRVLTETGTVYVNTVDGVSLGIDSMTEEEEEWPDGGVLGDGTVPVILLLDNTEVRTYQFAGTLAINHALQRLYALTTEGGTEDALTLLPTPTDRLHAVIPSADRLHIFVFAGPGGTIDKYHLLKWVIDDQEWEFVRTGTVAGGNAITNSPGPSGQGTVFAGMAETDLRHIWQVNAGGTTGFTVHYVADDFSIDLKYPYLTEALIVPGAVYIYADNGTAYAFGASYYFVLTRLDGAAINGQTLEEVHEAECALAGLADAQVNATALSAIIVEGMFIRRLGATRGVIGVLQPAYFYDTYESQGVLNAKRRGGSSVVTIDEEDLGASTSGEAEEDLINPIRADEDVLPGAAIVTYLDRASDYQPAAQHDRRSAVETDQPVNLEIPCVFSPDDARRIAGVWMYNQWIGRTSRTLRLSREYSYLEPTDVITVATDIADFVVRIVAIKTNDGYLEVECVDEDAALYTQNATGANVDQGSEIQLVTPSRLALLDIPMLRESDNDAGFYVAAAGYGDSWPGALILRSTDGGVSYTTVASVTTPAVMGIVSLALGNYVGPMGYDAVNQITVSLFGNQTLQSCTDAELLGGANAFALGKATIGYELIQFKTATLVTGKTWLLTQLLRGRRGTERLMPTHTTSETFVLLQTSTLRRIAIDDPATGVENHYKAVTFGQLVTLAPTVTFTNTSAGLKPYNPVNGKGTGFGSDITITWTRRGRIHNDWHDGIELPLGEVTESYVVEIWNAGNTSVLRTITGLSTPTTVYSSANQVTDFGSNPSTLNVRIYQLSAIVGRGFPLISTLS